MARKNSNHDLIINSSGDANNPSLRINNSSSNTFNHSIESFNSNLTSGETELILVGKEGSTKNSGYIGYYWSAAGSDDNYVSIGHWGNDHLFRVYGSGNVTVGGNRVLTVADEGSGNGLDADTVDGVHASAIVHGSNTSGTNEGTITNWNSVDKSGFYSDDNASNSWTTGWTSIINHRLYDNDNNYHNDKKGTET